MTKQLSEAFREFGEACATLARALGEVVRTLYVSMDVEYGLAYLWARENHPEWVGILNRTKRKRIRKKYQDRILREYRKSKEAKA